MAVGSVATTIKVRRLCARIGAEISGVSLRGASDDQIAGVRAALLAHRVVFIRRQDLSAREQIDFGRRLGPLTQGHPTLPVVDGEELILDLDSLAGGAANHWHTDVTFVDRPPMFSIIRAMVLPEVGGDTLWANTVAGYTDLPDDLRQLADGLRAVHSNGHDYGRPDVVALRAKLGEVRLANLAAFVSEVFETEHPVVRVHPETGNGPSSWGASPIAWSDTTPPNRWISSASSSPMSPVPKTPCAGPGKKATWPSGTTGPPSTTPSTTTARTGDACSG